MSHCDQQRLRQPQHKRYCADQGDRQQEAAPARRLEQPQKRDQRGQGSADQDCDYPIAVRDRQGDQLGRPLDLEILRCRKQDLEDKDNDDEGPDRAQPLASAGA